MLNCLLAIVAIWFAIMGLRHTSNDDLGYGATAFLLSVLAIVGAVNI